MVVIGADVPLVGRLAELDRIGEAVAAAATGRGRVVVVEGEAGIGKTRLLDAALDRARGLGLQVFRAHAEEFESRRPFGAVADCLGVTRSATDPRWAEISRRLYGGADTDATAGSEFRLVEGLVALVEDLCSDGPVVVALDDIQWADPATLLVAHGLARAAPTLRLLVILACRPAPRSPELARLLQTLAERGFAPQRLVPLSAGEVIELVGGLLGTPPGPRLARQVADAGGNPFFVTELVGALVADGAVQAEGATAEIASVAFPVALKPIVLHRMSFLSRATLDVLSVASVLGSTFTVPTLSLVLGRGALDLLPRVREALDAGVLGADGDHLAFRHDLLREALYEDIPRLVRVGVHRDIGHALAGAGAPAAAVAEHFIRGECRGDPVALDWLHRAVEEATVRAPATAAELLESTLELVDADDPDRDRLLAHLVVVLLVSSQTQQAERVCLDLLTRAQTPITEVRLRMALAQLANPGASSTRRWRTRPGPRPSTGCPPTSGPGSSAPRRCWPSPSPGSTWPRQWPPAACEPPRRSAAPWPGPPPPTPWGGSPTTGAVSTTPCRGSTSARSPAMTNRAAVSAPVGSTSGASPTSSASSSCSRRDGLTSPTRPWPTAAG